MPSDDLVDHLLVPDIYDLGLHISFCGRPRLSHCFSTRPLELLASSEHLEKVLLRVRWRTKDCVNILLLYDRPASRAFGFRLQLRTEIVHVYFAGLCFF